ncbi:MAG: Hsp20/alpha crystallin family protein [Neobacillus sp.]|jgi:HSP20 family protein
MDMEKLKQWMEIAQQMHGGDFWKNVFEQDFTKQFMNDQQPFKSNFNGFEEKSFGEEKNTRTFPMIDILEGDQEVLVLIELPGVKKENMELGLNGNILTIKGTALPIHDQLKLAYSERFYGEFKRQVKLPDTISPKDLNAKFWNGILFVSYQRKLEKGEIITID